MTVTTRFDSDQALASLSAFEILPEWLAAGMYGGRVGSSLEQHAAPLVDGSVTLVSCNPKRLRAKGEEWIPRYELRSPRRAASRRRSCSSAASGRPTRRRPSPSRRRPTTPTRGRAGCPTSGSSCTPRRPTRRCRRSRTLTDPALAARFLEPLIRAAGYTDATIESCETNVVRYKPTSRCTTVVPITYAEGTTGPVARRPQDPRGRQGIDRLGGHARALGPARDLARHRAARRAAGVRRRRRRSSSRARSPRR